jgi:muramoyltetrapeptide carboxypeptidase
MTLPKYLKKNSTIGICAIAKSIDHDRILPTVKALQDAGFRVVIDATIGAVHHQFAGDDAMRAAYFQEMIDDDSIDAVLFARGGYGTVRVLDAIDFSKFKQNPKWLCGFSDLTYLHSHLQQKLGVASIHSLMCSTYAGSLVPNMPMQSLVNALLGKKNKYEWAASTFNKNGSINGQVVGGNLSILCALQGSKSMIETKDKLLFIEDLDEYLYHFDRMLHNLKRSNVLKGIKGLLVGSFTSIKDNEIPFGKCIKTLILEATQAYNYPVIFDMPTGHQDDNRAIKLGVEASITFHQKQNTYSFEQ